MLASNEAPIFMGSARKDATDPDVLDDSKTSNRKDEAERSLPVNCTRPDTPVTDVALNTAMDSGDDCAVKVLVTRMAFATT